jgi:nucleoside-diphosphate-sugar epimerase
MSILVTGGTGFVGMELVARMLDRGDGPDIHLAVRARDRLDAQARLAETIGRLYETPPESAARLRAVRLDLTEPDLGMSAGERRALKTNVERVVHCAASISFTLPLDEARAINLDGTSRMLELASSLPRLERFVHVSTAYVGGRDGGVFGERDEGGAGEFRNTYEQTKAEAERVVTGAGLPAAIVRPSIVVGESDSGWTSAFNVLYWPLQAFARGLLNEVPADPEGVVDMVPVDYVAEVIERVAYEPDAAGCFHAVAGDAASTVQEMVDAICTLMERRPPRLQPPTSMPDDHPAGVFAPYFDVRVRFDDARAAALAGPAPDPLSYLPRLLEYARTARWGRRQLTREAARLALRAWPTSM